MYHHGTRWSVPVALAAVAAAALVGAAGARADDPACPSSTADAYKMKLRALTGPAGADLTLAVDPAADGCAVPKQLKKIQFKTYAADGTLERTRNITDKDAPNGVANLDLGDVPRDRLVEADVLVDAGSRTYVVRGATKTLLRPDLIVTKVMAPKQALVGEPVTVKAVIAEQNGDVDATANVSLSALPGSAEPVEISRGGEATVTFENVTFGTAVPVDATVEVTGAAPAETDAKNNSRQTRIDVTEDALPAEKNVLFPSLGGYGAQFNHHLYAPISTKVIPPDQYPDIEQKVKELQPQLVRIFYSDNWEENADGTHPYPEYVQNYESFVKVVQLAQAAGATIEISYQNLSAGTRANPGPPMARYADALEDLVRNHGLTNVRWVEVGNEPNSPSGATTLDQYNALYRALNAQLVTRGLRDQLHLMGGGLVENAGGAKNHYAWMKWIAANMSDILDAYTEHVYWIYNDTGRLEYRLRDTWHLMNEVLPPEQRKPVYMMEYGIRGVGTCGTKPTFTNLYYAADPNCTDIWRTNIAGFQQLWFNVDSAQLGIAGTSKWDAYYAIYDRTKNSQLYWTTGPDDWFPGPPSDEEYVLTPTYNALWLLFHVTEPGWQILQVVPWEDDDWGVPQYDIEGHKSVDQPEKELTAFAGPNGELTMLGLDTNGRALNGDSPDPPAAYSIGGLPANTTFNLALWNANGDGTNSVAGTVTTNDAGVARFQVPLQAAFALTTVPVS